MTSYLSPVVISGMGMVTPLGNGAVETVRAMRGGKTGICPVVADGTVSLLMGKSRVADSDRLSGDMSAAFAVKAATDAWKQAGLDKCAPDPWRVATIIGSSKGRVGNFLPADATMPLQPFDVMTFPGHTVGLEVARRLGLAGPVLNYPAACATGIVSIIQGLKALQSDEADIVLAGSAETGGKALLMAAFKNMGALSSEMMRPFDVRRAGFNPGEGGAVFVLEREADAVARRAPILARLSGWDYRADAYHITAADPEGSTVAYSIRECLGKSGWDPEDVEYINAHGTATALNDIVECRAIHKALPGCSPLVSSVKPYIGHLLGASAAAELALVLACAEANFIPATPGLEQPDPDISLHFVPSGGMKSKLCRIIKLSLGFGGHIGVLALEIP